MSLNDPRWGRGSNEPQDKQDDRADGQKEDERQAGSRDDRASGADDRRAGESNSRNDRDERYPNGGQRDADDRRREEDLDRLWGEFSDLLTSIMNPGGQKRDRKDPRSQLKSRDDFSRDDDDRDVRDAADRSRGADAQRGGAAPEMREAPGGNGNGGGRGMSPSDFMSRIPRPRRQLSPNTGNFGLGILALCVLVGWAASGFYIVPEGQTGVVTTFGRYAKSTGPGFNWHMPAPVQDVELVDVSSVRTTQIGMRGSSDRLREALMLTDDENIVDVQFNVQYRIKSGEGAKDFLFNSRSPDMSVTQAAESAMREVVGRKTMDSVLFESKAEIAEAVRKSMQTMLDRYCTGIEVMSVAIQNAQPPEQVQAAFNDAVKAGQDRERAINLGEAYMNAVLPKAQGTAARLKEEAEGYKARVTEMARGDADRFSSVFAEYKKAPEVTRDRIYVDTMREIYGNVSKVYVDQKGGSNLLYLPLDKIVEATKKDARSAADQAADAAAQATMSGTGGAQEQSSSSAQSSGYAGASYQTEDDPRAMIRARTR